MNKKQMKKFKKFLDKFQKANGKHLKAIGWYDGKTPMDVLNHGMAEVIEALTALQEGSMKYYVNGKPEGVEPEVADVVLLMLDFAYMMGFSLGEAIVEKDHYNKTGRKTKK